MKENVKKCTIAPGLPYLIPGNVFSATSAEVPSEPYRYQNVTWRVNSADHWLAGENRHCLRHWTCGTRHNRPARFKSAQPAKDRTQLFWMSAPFLNNQKMVVSLSVKEVQTFLSLIAEERIQWELVGAKRNEKGVTGSRVGATITTCE